MGPIIFLLVALLPVASGAASAGCPCLTDWDRSAYYVSGTGNSQINIELGGTEYPYPADYGILNCTQHDEGLDPYCSVASPPDWCTSTWCYVDSDNCNLPTLLSSYFADAGLHYSYGTCGSTNSWASWFGENAASDGTHSITDLADKLESYLIDIVDAIEVNAKELTISDQSVPTCPANDACDCTTQCVNAPSWGQDIDVTDTTFWSPPGTDPNSRDTKIDKCLSNIVSNTFTRVAALEANVSYVGYEYYGGQTHGNYVQWPGTDWCPTTWDPRFRPWYAAAASGPKDVVIIIDSSGSMSGSPISDAREAAKKVLLTLTSADYVSIIDFSSTTRQYASGLQQATESNLALMEAWVDNIAAGGTTNYRAALRAGWEAFASGGTSSCNKVVLFLTDGQPDEWLDSDFQTTQANLANYDAHLLTYALGGGLDSESLDRLKRLACMNSGITYRISDSADLASTMAQYYEVLAPMIGPCQPRWIEYADAVTGNTLVAQCLAAHEMREGSSATSCEGGLDGIGDNGDGTVPSLLGVACIDLNLLVNIDVIQARPDWSDFQARIDQERASCGRHALNAAQLETLRSQVSSYAVCDPDSSANDDDEDCGEDCEEDSGGDMVGLAIGVGAGAFLCLVGVACAMMGRKQPQNNSRSDFGSQPQRTPQASASVQQQPVAMAMAMPVASYSMPQAVQAVPAVPMGKAVVA